MVDPHELIEFLAKWTWRLLPLVIGFFLQLFFMAVAHGEELHDVSSKFTWGYHGPRPVVASPYSQKEQLAIAKAFMELRWIQFTKGEDNDTVAYIDSRDR